MQYNYGLPRKQHKNKLAVKYDQLMWSSKIDAIMGGPEIS